MPTLAEPSPSSGAARHDLKFEVSCRCRPQKLPSRASRNQAKRVGKSWLISTLGTLGMALKLRCLIELAPAEAGRTRPTSTQGMIIGRRPSSSSRSNGHPLEKRMAVTDDVHAGRWLRLGQGLCQREPLGPLGGSADASCSNQTFQSLVETCCITFGCLTSSGLREVDLEHMPPGPFRTLPRLSQSRSCLCAHHPNQLQT